MGLSLKIISGPQAGKIFTIKPGMIVGRAETDVTISDPKISGRHAKFEINKDGALVLTDLGSTNGMRVQGQRIMQVVLAPGLQVKIGNTDCLFDEFDNKVDAPSAENEKLPPIPAVDTNENDASIVIEPATWTEYFSDLSVSAQSKINSDRHKLYPFKPLLKLTAIQGLQAGQEWSLGYGPRAVGIHSLDVILMSPESPKIAFTITPSGPNAKFATESPEKVRLNGQSKKAEILQEGDLIQFENTTLRVSFIE